MIRRCSPKRQEEICRNFSRSAAAECFFSAAAARTFVLLIRFTLLERRRALWAAHGDMEINYSCERPTHTFLFICCWREMRVQHVGCFLRFLYPRSAFVSAQKFLFSYKRRGAALCLLLEMHAFFARAHLDWTARLWCEAEFPAHGAADRCFPRDWRKIDDGLLSDAFNKKINHITPRASGASKSRADWEKNVSGKFFYLGKMPLGKNSINNSGSVRSLIFNRGKNRNTHFGIFLWVCKMHKIHYLNN